MRMFTRLFLLLGGLTTLSLAVVAVVLWRNSAELERNLRTQNGLAGSRALTKGGRLLESDLQHTHRKIVREKAKNLEAFFARIADTVRLEAALTSQFLADSGTGGDMPPIYSDLEIKRCQGSGEGANPDFCRNVLGKKPYTMYHIAPGVAPVQIEERLRRLRRLGGFLAETRHDLAGCDSVHFGDSTGFILGYPGIRPFKEDYDPRKRDWYTQGMKRHGLIWLAEPDKGGSLVLTCAQRMAPTPGAEPVGVVAIDVRLADVLKELFNVGNLNVSMAILLDGDERVRVGANYVNETAVVDKELLTAKPPLGLGDLLDKGFIGVADQIHLDPAAGSGVTWTGPVLTRGENMYIYSVVHFPAADEGGPAPAPWYYIVRLPVASVVQPIQAVSGEIDQATRDTTAAIQTETTRSTTVIVGGIVVAFLASLGIAYLAARATARPLKQMAEVADAVGTGNLSQTAVETGGGEVGDLGRAINAMVRGLRKGKVLQKERNLLKETFARYVAPSVVDEVLTKGDVRLGGVKRVVTVFFSDLKGFTTLSEKTDPEALVQLLNEYFEAMTGVILASEGTLDKYIGDGILAFWGEPIAHDDDASRACRAALDQALRLETLCDAWQARGLDPVEMRVGIQTGLAVVGNVGSNLKFNYTVLGDTVNLASRLESVNKIYGTRVLIGEETRRAADGAVEVREVDRLAVFGKHESVRVYELLGMTGDVPAGRREGYAEYELGLAAYRSRRWEEAATHFLRTKAILGRDQVSDVLLARIERYRVDPPAGGWDGTYVLDQK